MVKLVRGRGIVSICDTLSLMSDSCCSVRLGIPLWAATREERLSRGRQEDIPLKTDPQREMPRRTAGIPGIDSRWAQRLDRPLAGRNLALALGFSANIKAISPAAQGRRQRGQVRTRHQEESRGLGDFVGDGVSRPTARRNANNRIQYPKCSERPSERLGAGSLGHPVEAGSMEREFFRARRNVPPGRRNASVILAQPHS